MEKQMIPSFHQATRSTGQKKVFKNVEGYKAQGSILNKLLQSNHRLLIGARIYRKKYEYALREIKAIKESHIDWLCQ